MGKRGYRTRKRVALPPIFGLSQTVSSGLPRGNNTAANMASQDVRFAYKETRINLDPSPPSSVVRISVPAHASQGRSNSRRLNGAESSVLEEEKAFRAKSLATASSVYHRVHHASPRSFLWRILEVIIGVQVVFQYSLQAVGRYD